MDDFDFSSLDLSMFETDFISFDDEDSSDDLEIALG